MKRWFCVFLGILAAGAAQDPAKEQLRKTLKDDIAGTWIYDDVNAGFAEARKAAKPLLIVFR